jgi:FtsZ-binding cell division protein ZapB
LKGNSSMTLPTDGTTPQAQTETPNPSVPAGNDPSQGVTITKADWDRVQSLLGRVEDLQGGRDISRQTQSEVSKLKEDMRPLLERAHSLGSQNKPLNEALTQIQTEQTDAEFRRAVLEIAQSMRSGGQPTGTGNAPGVDVAKVLADYQLDPKDPFVAGKIGGKTFATVEEAENAALRIAWAKLQISTNPAQQSATPGAPTISTDEAALLAELQVLSKTPTGNMERIMEINKVLKGR